MEPSQPPKIEPFTISESALSSEALTRYYRIAYQTADQLHTQYLAQSAGAQKHGFGRNCLAIAQRMCSAWAGSLAQQVKAMTRSILP
jgi:hypothetical protein